MGKEPYLRGMWEAFLQERSRVKSAGIQGQWQQESPAREYLEQVKCCHDTDCNEPMMLKSGNWEEYKDTLRKMMKAPEWACDRIKEARLSSKSRACSKVRTNCGESLRPLKDKVSQCRTCDRTATVSLWKTGLCWEKPQNGGAQFVKV